jgi:hypothetical protein
MDDLVAFLNARLDEDEARARATLRPGGPLWSEVGYGERIPEMAHIERHSPARVLRDVEAKRAIVRLAAKVREWTDGSAGATAGYAAAVVGDTLCALAAIDSDHPDYRPEWKP